MSATSAMDSSATFDHIIVGAGSAGCVLAASIASASDAKVLLLEAGGDPRSNKLLSVSSRRPAEYLQLQKTELDWDFECMPCEELASRRLQWPRGRGLGGSSAINAMIYHEGHPDEFNSWHQHLGDDWTATEIQRSFHELRSRLDVIGGCETPSDVADAAHAFMESARSVVKRGDAKGCPEIYQRTTSKGVRSDAFDTFIRGRELKNLVVRPHSLVDRIQFNGDVASGVILADEQATEIQASAGVTLCAGAIASPAILMRSGIGPQETLQRLGVKPILDSQSVGKNLQDHLVFPVIFATPDRPPFPSQWSEAALRQWQEDGAGPVASNLAECGGFFDSGVTSGDSGKRAIQFHVTPTHYLLYPSPDAPSAITLAVSGSRPASRGFLEIASTDPLAKPTIHPGYLEAPKDLDVIIEGISLARKIASEEPLARMIQSELLPGSKKIDSKQLSRVIRRFAMTLYHPTSTCRMGCDPESVVDPEFCVRGVENLRVVDASAFPEITRANPNATTMMLALRAAKVLLRPTV